MYAIYSKRLEEIYYAQDKELVELFLNDRCRTTKDFLVKEIDNNKLTQKDLNKIEDNEITEAYHVERAITRDEAQFFDEISVSEIYTMRSNLNKLIKSSNKLKLSKEDKDFCDSVIGRYYEFLNSIIEYDEDYDEYYECYDWMLKFCNLNVIYDSIIKHWTGKM